MKLYGQAMPAPNPRRVRWFLAEKGAVDIEIVDLDVIKGEHRDPGFREQFGVTVMDFYGLSEGYPLCANFPWMEVREGSMGRVMPGWDIAILDEDERPVGVDDRGEHVEFLVEAGRLQLVPDIA